MGCDYIIKGLAQFVQWPNIVLMVLNNQKFSPWKFQILKYENRKNKEGTFEKIERTGSTTVDGRNPAPLEMYKPL